jgi:outer membrane translocation and assembly module TamA
MCNANIELRFPIFKKMGGVIFQDLGMLSSDRFADFTPHNILAATGFGGRFHTPLGPLRFDIGWKWRRESKFERSYAWFLTFGQAF